MCSLIIYSFGAIHADHWIVGLFDLLNSKQLRNEVGHHWAESADICIYAHINIQRNVGGGQHHALVEPPVEGQVTNVCHRRWALYSFGHPYWYIYIYVQ